MTTFISFEKATKERAAEIKKALRKVTPKGFSLSVKTIVKGSCKNTYLVCIWNRTFSMSLTDENAEEIRKVLLECGLCDMWGNHLAHRQLWAFKTSISLREVKENLTPQVAKELENEIAENHKTWDDITLERAKTRLKGLKKMYV